MSDEANSEAAPLSGDAQARWEALKEAVGELAGSVGDTDGFVAAFAALRQVGGGIDSHDVLNAVHVPDDAGEHSEALRRMLLRIPDGWGRWIGCSRGWYPILVELNEQLAALLPAYELEQVKEKYGGLCFYWSPGERVTDPGDPEPDTPKLSDETPQEEKDAAWSEWESVYDAWSARLARYLETEEGVACRADLERRCDLAEQLVDAAEQRASVTCELCGLPGRSCRTQGPHPWYQTLCATCAERHGYSVSSQSG